jgi:hypothetical protein
MLMLVTSALAADFCAGFGGGPVPEFHVDPLAPPSASDTCWGQQYEHRVDTEHFAIEWSGSEVSEDLAENWGRKLEDAYTSQIALGFREPRLHEDHKTLVLLTEGSGRSYVAGADCPDGQEVAFIVLEIGGSIAYPDALASHELNHVFQHAYDSGHELWFWEATATWAQAQNAPDEREWALFLVSYGLMPYPWLGMRRSDRAQASHDAHMYGMAAWLFFLQQELGGEVPAQLWEASQGTGHDAGLPIQTAVEDAGLDFRELFGQFMLTTAHDRFDESFADVEQVAMTASLPYEGEVQGAMAPETQGMSFVTVLPEAISAEHGDVLLTIEAEPEGDWIGFVSAERLEVGLEVVELDLSGGSQQVLVEDISTTRGVTISMSPQAGDLDTWTWSWAGELTGDPPSDPRPGTSSAFVDEGGCSSSPRGGGPLAVLLGLLVLGGRYRAQIR